MFEPFGYEVLGKAWHDGYAEGFKARDLHRGRLVALKTSLGRGGSYAEHARRDLLREAEVIIGVRHPHVEQLVEVFECNGHPVLAVEWVEGCLWGTPPWPRASPRAAWV